MANERKKKRGGGRPKKTSFFASPGLGSTLTVLSGLSFLILCVLLPMVGQAGAATSFADQNKARFTMFLLVSMILSILAILSKSARRGIDQSPRPYFSYGMLGLTVLLFVALYANWLEV